MKWVSLHGHSTFSFQDGFGPVADHVARVKDLGMNTLALTEHGNVSSHVQLEKACNEAGIRPIFGVEAYVAPPGEKLKFHLTILAMNVEGYTNLNRIVTSSWLYENFHYYPTVHDDVLEKYSEGLIILSGCADSQLACTLFGGKSLGEKRLTYTEEDWAAAVDLAMWYKNTFGDRYYLEVQRLDRLPRTRAINKAYEKLSKETGIPLVATADVHYPFPEDNDMQTVLHAAGRGSDYETTRNSWDYSVLLTYPESDREVYDNMVKTGLSPEAAAESCRNTAKIAARCEVKLPQNEPIKFPVPEEFKDVEDMVWAKLREGWEFRIKTNKRMRKNKKEYVDRLHYEMERIVPRGFCDYFMMLADVVVWAKEQKIPVGPARGSAASSLVCYLMRITEVDPLEFPQMMFERFIDPKRLDLPDVDLDFADDRRHEVIHHLQERWGYDHVGNIGNFNRYRGKNSIDDIARVFHIPKFAAEGVKDLIIDRSGGDSRAADSLQDTFDMFPKAEALAEKFPALRRATKLEGNYKGLGIHAAGVVISNNPIEETCALYEKKKSNGDDVRVVPYDKKDAVYLGMLKADFLGLSTMGLIGIALDIIGMDLEDLYRIPLDEPETIAAFNRADVVGIFQFEGRATRLVCQDVKPETFLELADINALSRPGPLFSGMTSSYIDIKHGRAEPDHLHPIVDSFTAWSKYQIVYQEQVLSIIRDVGGFSVQRVGDIRKIISQKLGEASFNAMYEEFEKGAKELHGIDSKLAMKIWKFMVTSATYSFNTAHSISYAMLAFWCMWLKVHHPVAFYTAALQKTGNNKDQRPRLIKLIRDANRHGVPVVPPSLNVSGITWTAGDGYVTAGFSQVPGVGERYAANILAVRDKIGHFSDVSELSEARGIGPKSVKKIKEFMESEDPFGLGDTERALNKLRDKFADGTINVIPAPTHTSANLPKTGDTDVVWMGMVKNREFKDIIEDERAKTGDSLEEIRARVKAPELAKSCTLHCYDDGDEEVYARINRMDFPFFKESLEDLVEDSDIVVIKGRKREGFGLSIRVEEMYVIQQ